MLRSSLVFLVLVAAGLALPADELGRHQGIVFRDVSKESGARFKMTAGKDPSTQLLEVKGSGVASRRSFVSRTSRTVEEKM